MSRNGQTARRRPSRPAIVIARFPMAAGTRFDWHRHIRHQLAWVPVGVITVETEGATFVLPPTRALWIPAGVRHEVRSGGGVEMQALYVGRRTTPITWRRPTAVAITPLIAELIGYLADPKLTGSRRAHAEAVLIDVLEAVPVATIDVRMPVDKPARKVAEALIARPADRSTLAQWGRRVGASERTLARSFVAGCGLAFARWRTFVRLQAALPRLASGAQVSTVAHEVGYETASAFVAAFVRETGVTPAAYFRGAASE